jgi:multicomponent Na+:H+ antiporter subunit C
MEVLLALISGTLYASGIYLMLKRRLAQIIVGLSMLANASNILIFTAAGLRRERAPIVAPGETPTGAEGLADPVPQALILTAIVIGFGVLAFSLVLAHRVQRTAGTDDVDAITAGEG